MNMKFTKMHGLGNDFMVIDGINQHLNLNSQQIAHLAHRNTGVGFDQCLIIERATRNDVDFNYRIFNADGSEVGQCGNGARCLALFAKHHGLTTKNKLKVVTKTTTMNLSINEDDTVSVDMGQPHLDPQQIPLLAPQQASTYPLELNNNQHLEIHAVNVGNPHAILIVDDIFSAPVADWGRQISLHKEFPEQTNAGFMQIISPQHLRLRVYERGCGETLACGSGAVAAAVIGRLYHHMNNPITVSLPGGDLVINWPNVNEPVLLTGPAIFVYEGNIELF
ncbi:MAG TPA: diaminopimelate epimerase [Legionella sp.]|nr:diaminopimelate epimerase [Legionella sp.]